MLALLRVCLLTFFFTARCEISLLIPEIRVNFKVDQSRTALYKICVVGQWQRREARREKRNDVSEIKEVLERKILL